MKKAFKELQYIRQQIAELGEEKANIENCAYYKKKFGTQSEKEAELKDVERRFKALLDAEHDALREIKRQVGIEIEENRTGAALLMEVVEAA